jgi:hypothetical protein
MAIRFPVSRRYRAGKRIPSLNAVLPLAERVKAAKKIAQWYRDLFGPGPVSPLDFKKRVKQINAAMRAVALKTLRRSPAMLARFSLDTPRSNERFAIYAAQRQRLSGRSSSIKALETAKNVANDVYGVRSRGVLEHARRMVSMKMY